MKDSWVQVMFPIGKMAILTGNNIVIYLLLGGKRFIAWYNWWRK